MKRKPEKLTSKVASESAKKSYSDAFKWLYCQVAMEEQSNKSRRNKCTEKEPILYIVNFKEICGSVNSSILLSRMIYWNSIHQDKPFKKFIAPPKTPRVDYTIGESWTEDLGFSRREFETALSKLEKLKMCSHHRSGTGITEWKINMDVILKKIEEIKPGGFKR